MTATSTDDGDDSDVGVEKAEEFASEHPGLVKFARVGWTAKGLVYGLTGVLALLIGLRSASGESGSSGSEASQTGAIARIAEHPTGVVVLVVVAAGLVVYALWRFVSVLLPGDNDVQGWVTRGGYLVGAVTALALAWTAVTFARDPGQPDDGEDSKVESFTTDLMSRSFGRGAVFVIGVILVGVGLAFVWKAYSAAFEKELRPGGVGPVSHRMLVRIGRVGWAGRAAMMVVIGFFFARSAVRFDPEDAQGLDGSLRKAAGSGVGTALVIAVGLGLLAYGIFCVLSAPKRRLVGARS